MPVQDIFKIQTAYNQNGSFNDQVDWQDAFKIADNFNTSSAKQVKANELWRSYNELMNTQQTRVDTQNAINRDKLNEANWATAFRDSTEQNRINYTNWDYGNKQRVGDLDWNIKQQDALRASEARVREAELDKWFKMHGIKDDGSLATMMEMSKYARELDPATFRQVFPNFFPNAKPTEAELENLKFENRMYENAAKSISEMIAINGGALSEEGMKTIMSMAQFQPPRVRDMLVKNFLGEQQPSTSTSALPTTLGGQSIGVRFPGMPTTLTETNAQTEMKYPYALPPVTTEQVVQAISSTPNVAPQLIDYRTRFNLSDNDLALANRLMAATGQTEQEALKDLNGYFLSRESGINIPEKVEQLILAEIEKAERLKRIQAQVPTVTPNAMTEVNRLMGNTRTKPTMLFNGINQY